MSWLRQARRGLVAVFVTCGLMTSSAAVAAASGPAGAPSGPASGLVQTRFGQPPAGTPDPVAPPWPQVRSAGRITDSPTPPATAAWPAAGVTEVTLGAAGRSVDVGGSGVAIVAASSTADGRRLRVEVLGRDVARRLGNAALVATIKPGGGTGRLAGGPALPVDVTISYRAFEYGYGAGYASRLRVVALPACALAVPVPAGCGTGLVLPATNDREAKRLLVKAADLAALASDMRPGASADKTPGAPAAGPPSDEVVLAVMAGTSGEDGDFRASPLAATSDWEVGPGSGNFSWRYPLPMPAPPAGSAPAVAVAYSSGSVDGLTSTRNTQAGQMGLGFGDFAEAFVERRYVTCAGDGVTLYDLCWQSDNAVLSLNGRSAELIPLRPTPGPTAPKQWRLANDPRWRVEQLFGAAGDPASGDEDKEWWRVTTPDGTQFWFGRGFNPDDGAATGSVLWTPVVGDTAGEPCNGGDSICEQGWRWMLDRIVDPNGNVATYTYVRETNRYLSAMGFGGVRSYVPAGRLRFIEYGGHTGPAAADKVPAQARVEFSAVFRCASLSDLPANQGGCQQPLQGASGTDYPDVPVDLICSSNCTVTSPTFFSTKRYTKATTSVLVDGAWKPVDELSFTHAYKANPLGDKKLYLTGVQRAGLSATPTLRLAATTLDYVQLDNRVTIATHKHPHYRVSQVVDEFGRKVSVTYGQPNPCPNDQPPAGGWDNNPYDCFRQQWLPDGATAPINGVFRKWLVTQVKVEDTTTGSPAMTTRYGYEGTPAWHYDTDRFVWISNQGWTDWRGYGTVLVTQGSSRTRSRIFRGMHGDRLASGASRTVEISSLDDANLKAKDWNWIAGATFDEAQLSSGSSPVTLAGTVHTYRVAATVDDDSIATNDPHPEKAAVWIGEETTTRRDRKPDGSYARRRTTTLYNGFLLFVDAVEESGWLDVTGDERCTRTGHVIEPNTWMLDYPSSERLTAGLCSVAGTELRMTETAYDGGAYGGAPTKGNPTKTRTKVTATPTWAETTVSYDVLGRPTAAVDALGRRTTTTYTPDKGNVKQTRTAALAHLADQAKWHATTTDMLVVRGMPTKLTDANGNVTTFGYDALGRTVSIRQPTEQPAGEPNSWEFAYVLDNNRAKPPVVRTRQLQAGGTAPVFIDSWAVYDSLLRQRQTHRLSPAGGKVIVTHTDYDDRGNPVNEAFPQALAGTPGIGILTPAGTPTPWENRKQIARDELGRPGWEIHWANPAGDEPESYLWSAVTSYTHDSVVVTRDRGGNVTTVADAYGRTIRMEEQAVRGSDANKAITRYGYNAAGDLTSVVDPANRQTTYGYDLARRRTAMTDPDAGAWTYGYDLAGNMTRVQDARASGNTTYTNYDGLNRPVERRQDHPTTGRILAAWAYDAPGQKGLLDSSVSFHRRPSGEGDEAFIVDMRAYDARNRPTHKAYTLFADRGGLFGTYEFFFAYDRADHLIATVHPQVKDANGQEVLPGEWVITEYNNLGLPTKVDSTLLPAADDAYFSLAGYDDRARPRWFGFGPQVGGVWKFFEYDKTQRLTHTETWAAVQTSGQAQLQNRTLIYDQTQNITRRTTTLGGKSWMDCYVHDDRNRLTRAYTTSHANACATSGAGTGDAPYDHAYSYTVDGNITRRVENVTNQNPTTYDYTYPASATRPHAPTAVDSSVSGEDVTYTWNPIGQLDRRERSNGDYDTFIWTADRRLDAIRDPNGNVRDSFAYDVDGVRVLRENVDRTTIYFEGHEISANGGGGVTAVRTYSLGGQSIATRTRDTSAATPTLEYLVSDNQDSVEMSIKAGENTPSAERTYLPYGKKNSGNELLTDRGWIGQVEDRRTGLNYLNQRYYDPNLARFISPDPVYLQHHPQTLNPYAYGLNNPAVFSDPSGLCGLWVCDQIGDCLSDLGDCADDAWDATGGKVVAAADDAIDSCLADLGSCADKAARTFLAIAGAPLILKGAILGGINGAVNCPSGTAIATCARAGASHGAKEAYRRVEDLAVRAIDVAVFIRNAPVTIPTALVNVFTHGDCDWRKHLTVVCYGGFVSELGSTGAWTTGNTINTTQSKEEFEDELLRHETWHSRQSAILGPLTFGALYQANKWISDAMSGDQRYNVFEWWAGFEDGDYDCRGFNEPGPGDCDNG